VAAPFFGRKRERERERICCSLLLFFFLLLLLLLEDVGSNMEMTDVTATKPVGFSKGKSMTERARIEGMIFIYERDYPRMPATRLSFVMRTCGEK
jgi:hypothetical protein